MNILNYWKNLYNWKNPLNWWRLPGYWCRAIKYVIQRATRGFSDLDCWDLYNMRIMVILKKLESLMRMFILTIKLAYMKHILRLNR